MSTTTLRYLILAALLAGCTFPGRRVSDSASAQPWAGSAVCATSLPATSGGAGLLLAPAANRLVAGSGSLRLAPTPVVHITP